MFLSNKLEILDTYQSDYHEFTVSKKRKLWILNR